MRKSPLDLVSSPALHAFTKAQEGLRLHAYNDGFGTWTIGWGHTVHVQPNDEITEASAERYFASDISLAASGVKFTIKADLSQGEFDTLTDFAYNVGNEALERSDVARLVNASNYAQVPAALYGWSRAGGKFNDDLYKRRKLVVRQFWQLPV